MFQGTKRVKITRRIVASATIIVILIAAAVLNLPPRQVDMSTATQLAESSQITALDLSGSTLTVTTKTERIRVEGVTQEVFDTLLTTTVAHNTNVNVAVSLSPDMFVRYRVYTSLLAPILLLSILAMIAYFLIKRTRRLHF